MGLIGFVKECRDLGPKSKRNALLVLAWLVGVNLFWFFVFQANAPKGSKRTKVPVACGLEAAPYTRFTCPMSMMCTVDFEFPELGYGKCVCENLKGQVPRLPTFDDGEVDDLFSEIPIGRHCRLDWPLPFLSTLIALPLLFSLWIYGTMTHSTMWKLVKQNDKFKWNSTTRGLAIAMAGNFYGVFFSDIAFLLAMWGVDKYFTGFFYDHIFFLGTQVLTFCYNLGSCELTISWFDLVQRTVKMSRTSSKSITFVKWFLRIFNITWNGVLSLAIKIDNSKITEFFSYVTIANMVINLVPGIILSRMLCKDRKDVTNPNWKAAQVIRRTTRINFSSQLVALVSYQLMSRGIYPDYFNRSSLFWYTYIALHYGWLLLSAWAWMHYILFGCRKMLMQSDNDKISQYFGFTTIGLNSTIASSVSAFSSVASSVASRVSVASTVEKDDDEGKAET